MKTEKIISIKSIGRHPTVDIEVDHSSHLFYANSIATSNSHAVSYAINSYLTAYTKAHFSHEFFTSSLYHSKTAPHPQERIQELVGDSKSFNIDIRPPSLLHLGKNFQLIDKTIYFGFTNIKGIGDSVYNKLQKRIKIVCDQFNKKLDQLTWIELLIFLLCNVTSTSAKAMCNAGVLSHLKKDRKQMHYEYEKYSLLSTKEQEWVKKNFQQYRWTNLSNCINTLIQLPTGKMGACANQKRKNLMEEIYLSLTNPPYSLIDSPVFLAEIEEELMGVPITCTSVEACDISDATCDCQSFLKRPNKQTCWIAVSIDRKHEIITKTKKKMCFLTCSDISGSLDSVVVFPEPYKQYRPLLFDKNNVMIVGNQGKDKGSFIVKKIYQL